MTFKDKFNRPVYAGHILSDNNAKLWIVGINEDLIDMTTNFSMLLEDTANKDGVLNGFLFVSDPTLKLTFAQKLAILKLKIKARIQ